MTYLGYFSNGYVKLDDAVSLPEGTPVKVEVLIARPSDDISISASSSTGSVDEPVDPDADELVALLLRYAGTAKGLPSDWAANHDHYIHGKPLP
jgi:hypothetical protein